MQKLVQMFLMENPWESHGLTYHNEKLKQYLNDNILLDKITTMIDTDIVDLFFNVYKLKNKYNNIEPLFELGHSLYPNIRFIPYVLELHKKHGDFNYCGFSLNAKSCRKGTKYLIPSLKINTIMQWNQLNTISFDLITYKYFKNDEDQWICDVTNLPRWNLKGIAKFYEYLLDNNLYDLLVTKLQEELISIV